MSEPSFTVVVPTLSRPESLDRLLTALRDQVAGRAERAVIVVNDGNPSDAYAKVAARHADFIDYVALPANRGQAAARNEAARRAHRQFLVFIDDDCVPPPYWLDWLSAALSANPDVDVVGGTTHPLPGAKASLLAGYLTAVEQTPKPEVADGVVQLFVGANLAVRRPMFAAVGGFDERLRACEESNLMYRLRRSGAVFYFDPAWYVLHEVDQGVVAHLRRFHGYGYWKAVGRTLEPAAVPPVELPAPRPWTWLWEIGRSLARHHRRHRGLSDRPLRRAAFAALGAVTEWAFKFGYLRGSRAARP